MGSHSCGFEMLVQLSAPCPPLACLVTGSPCVIVVQSTTIMLLRCQTFTKTCLHLSWGQKGTDTERPCQEALQVSCLGYWVGNGPRVWKGGRDSRWVPRAGRFSSNLVWSLIIKTNLWSSWVPTQLGCVQKQKWESIFVHEIHHTFLWASIVEWVWVVYTDAFPAHHKLCI